MGICDGCGFQFTHSELVWQYEWMGPRLGNQRKLVCRTCNDEPQEQLRTLILPPDPTPIANPRPENYRLADNPISFQQWSPLALVGNRTGTGNIGNLFNLDAAFRPPAVKPSQQGALRTPSAAGATNYLGKDWSATTGGPAAVAGPSSLIQGLTYAVSSFVAQAPSDQPFLATGATAMEFDGWNGTAWVSIWSGTSSGSSGETMSVSLPSSLQTQYYGHRLVITGNGSRLGVASLTLSAAGDGVRSSAPAVAPS